MTQFRSQTDMQLAARHDAAPWVDQYGTRWETGRTDPLSSLKPRVECIPSRDPLPWQVLGDGWQESIAHPSENESRYLPIFEPRPEYARPPVNQLLTAARAAFKEGATAVDVLEDLDGYQIGYPGATHLDDYFDTPARESLRLVEIDHARKVLARLASLKEQQ